MAPAAVIVAAEEACRCIVTSIPQVQSPPASKVRMTINMPMGVTDFPAKAPGTSPVVKTMAYAGSGLAPQASVKHMDLSASARQWRQRSQSPVRLSSATLLRNIPAVVSSPVKTTSGYLSSHLLASPSMGRSMRTQHTHRGESLEKLDSSQMKAVYAPSSASTGTPMTTPSSPGIEEQIKRSGGKNECTAEGISNVMSLARDLSQTLGAAAAVKDRDLTSAELRSRSQEPYPKWLLSSRSLGTLSKRNQTTPCATAQRSEDVHAHLERSLNELQRHLEHAAVIASKAVQEAVEQVAGEPPKLRRSRQLEEDNQPPCPPRAAAVQLASPQAPLTSRVVLNCASFPGGVLALPLLESESVDAAKLSVDLQTSMLSLYNSHLYEDGRKVDYDALRSSCEFVSYVRQSSLLAAADLGRLTLSQRKAFLINIYNALVVHATTVLGGFAPEVEGSISSFFRNASYAIAGHVYSLDEIEHGLLRGNEPHPSGNCLLEEGDARLAFSVPLDARVHCALVCGAKSCPPIRVYDEENLDEGLDLAVSAFCESEVTISGNVITMSKIFDWYGRDFGVDDAAKLSFLARFLEEPTATGLRELLSCGALSPSNPDGFICRYSRYDWRRNGLC